MRRRPRLADADARDCGGHGTNVAGIIAGFNNQTGQTHEDAQGFNYGVGIQPFGQIGATKIFKCAGPFDVTTSVAALHASAYAAGARISNNSWGSDVGGAYNARSQEFDCAGAGCAARSGWKSAIRRSRIGGK